MAAVQQVLFSIGTSVSLPSSLSINASGESFAGQNAVAMINLTLRTNNLLNVNYSAEGDIREPAFPQQDEFRWLTGGSSNLYSARMRVLSGSFGGGSSSVNTWLPITSNLTWGILSTSDTNQPLDADSVTAVLEIAFSDSLDTILTASQINFNTQASTQTGLIP